MALVTVICIKDTEDNGRRYVAGQALTVSEEDAARLTLKGVFRRYAQSGPARADRMVHSDGIRTPEGGPRP